MRAEDCWFEVQKGCGKSEEGGVRGKSEGRVRGEAGTFGHTMDHKRNHQISLSLVQLL